MAFGGANDTKAQYFLQRESILNSVILTIPPFNNKGFQFKNLGEKIK